jgi:UDP-N-acetylmuramoyl-tripeptide--D-alanyl-D-alanine ligase
METNAMTTPALWPAAEAAAATNGMQVGEWSAAGVSIDSRSVVAGDLFVALRGPNFDGHDYVKDALARGAAAVMVDRVPQGVPHDAPLLVVDDTMDGLTDLARFARMRSEARVVGVTGSVGKTSTKEALKLALSATAPAYASQGNLNNQWGAPLSLSRMPEQVSYGVFELGMNHAGEIAPLSRLVEPDVAIITNVEAVHAAHFHSVEGIADAKAEIFRGMGPESTAILNRDNPFFPRLVAHARTQGVGRIWSFGEHAEADARLIDCSLHTAASAVNAMILGEPLRYTLSAPGKHWVLNSLSVLLAAKGLGANIAGAARAMGRITPLRGRGARVTIELQRGGQAGKLVLIDESYNASPVSVAASLEVLGGVDSGPDGRRIAVLGDMLELGPDSPALHAGLKQHVLANDIDLVFTCGPDMKQLHDALPEGRRGAHAADSAALAAILAEAVRPGDCVMVKGSLGSRMAVIVEALENLRAARENRAPQASPKRVANGL